MQTVYIPAGWVLPQVPSPQRENAPPVPAQPPFAGWNLALRPVCSAVLGTRGSETQLHLFHAADVWQTTGASNMVRKGENISVYGRSGMEKINDTPHTCNMSCSVRSISSCKLCSSSGRAKPDPF